MTVLDETIGAFEIGVLVSLGLLGTVMSQVYHYFGYFVEDPLPLKIAVGVVAGLELIYTICISHSLYHFTITNFNNPKQFLGAFPPSFMIAFVATGTTGVIVNLFCCWRIHRLVRNPFWRMAIPGFLACCAVTWYSFGWAATVYLFEAKHIPEFVEEWGWLLMAIWIASPTTDIGVTATLVYILNDSRKAGVHKTTDVLVDKVITWTIETGLLTSLAGIAALVAYLTSRETFIWLGIFAVRSRLFANSFLTSLNCRKVLRAMNNTNTYRSFSKPPGAIDVQMTKVTLRRTDSQLAGMSNDLAGTTLKN
ncbi:hypothetical protein MKEN_00272100 [Mycena kentingensis (nom. inval.)]|nr:hypothetical protein MKEN_00272100 [Mycena kentingensis (nom. inval.)]